MKTICSHSGKVIFASKGEALEIMLFLKCFSKRKDANGRRRKHRRGKVRMKRVYYCNECDGFHITGWAWYPYSYCSKKIKSHESNLTS